MQSNLIFPSMLQHLLVDNLVHDLEPLDGLLLCDTDKLLLQGHGPETVVKEEETLGGLHPQEGSNILVVGQCGREPDKPHVFLGRLDVSDSSRETI